MPLMVLVAFELGVAGAEICLACMMVTWMVMTMNGFRVPWATVGLRDAMLVTQMFLAVFSATIYQARFCWSRAAADGHAREHAEGDTGGVGAIIGAEARYRLVVDHVSETVMRVAPGGLVLLHLPPAQACCTVRTSRGCNLFSLMQERRAARDKVFRAERNARPAQPDQPADAAHRGDTGGSDHGRRTRDHDQDR